MKLLKDLYQNHFGKVSQKWAIYFNQYEEKFSKYKKFPIKLFEIGIENGGSLEIYSKYFSNAALSNAPSARLVSPSFVTIASSIS